MFDVYDDMSTKNMAHKRKAAGKARATVTFTDDMKVTLRKDNFLRTSNSLINIQSQFLTGEQLHNFITLKVLLMYGLPRHPGIESAKERKTVLVVDVTDFSSAVFLLLFR